MPGEIRIGTASWTDPGFVADWYPKELPSSDRLAWYAQRFNLVEVNSSFYAIPNQKMVARWCAQTPPGFIFDFKLHRLLSRHSTTANSLPPDLRHGASEKLTLTPALEAAVAKRFLHELEPLREAGKLGALFLQLSPSFQPRAHALDELLPLFDLLAPCRLAVELRHRDWVTGEQLAGTLEFFRKRNISFVSIDGPRAAHFMIMPSDDFVTQRRLAYLRCHGRNAEGFIKGRTVAERFNYNYPQNELEELAERAMKLAAQSEEVHVVFNNNASDYAPVNAARLRELLAKNFPQVSTGPDPRPAKEITFPENLELNLGGAESNPGRK